MRDLVVREALSTAAREAAGRFRELIAAGEELPYDVREDESAALPQYVPLTERFIADHAGTLRELDSFGAACASVESAGLAGPYLESFGIAVPAEDRRRGELAGIVFLCRLWVGSSDFSLDGDRLEAAIAELEADGAAADGEIEIAVPLRGFQMPVARLELATATVVRADTVDVPAEARATELSGGAGWEPTFLAVARIAAGADAGAPDAGARAVERFRALITTLRLFKSGGVALGAHAWTRSAGDRWRRISTGAGKPRQGGYRLADSELGELAGFSRALAERSGSFEPAARDLAGPRGALARAVSRFEAGLERGVPLEALNDYLLALRFLLEGGGPADLGLSMRVAALCSEPDGRPATRGVIERGLALERELWSGDPAASSDATPAETAAEIEGLVRAILKDAACGHLGSDLRATADEILLAEGLSVGEGASRRGETAEWDLEECDEEAELGIEQVSASGGRMTLATEHPAEEDDVSASPRPRRFQDDLRFEHRPERDPSRFAPPPARGEPSVVADAIERRPGEREAIAARVSRLFPRPEATDWDVRELDYDRRRRAEARP